METIKKISEEYGVMENIVAQILADKTKAEEILLRIHSEEGSLNYSDGIIRLCYDLNLITPELEEYLLVG
jgi:predicted transcriptional regulator